MTSDNVCPSLPGSFYRSKCILLLFIFVSNGKVSSLHRGWMFFHGVYTTFSFKCTSSLLTFLSNANNKVRCPRVQTPFSDWLSFLYTCLSKVVGSYDSCLMFLRNFCTYPTKAIIYIKTTVCEVLHMPTPSLALSFIFLVTAILINIG